jgi:hypothetical protein
MQRPKAPFVSVVGATIVVTLLLSGLSGSASANHMRPENEYPYVHWFWDVGNDHDGDPLVGVDADGTGWTQTMLDRLTESTDHWTASTDFGPYRVVSGDNDFWVDGTLDSYCYYQGSWLGATCVHRVLREDAVYGQWYDIYQVSTTIDPTLDTPLSWWYGAAHSSSENVVDFRGVVTHELGHWVRLIDVYDSGCNYGPDMYTMCGAPEEDSTIDDDFWRARSLTTHDINAANIDY